MNGSMIKVTDEYPKKPSLDYLIENRTNKGWADYVMENHYSILNNFTDADLPEACYILAHTLNYQIMGKEITDDDYHTNQVISDICRMGINSYLEGKDHKEVMVNNLANADRIGDLFLSLAVAMMNSYRPIAAFGYLDNAEKCYCHMIEMLKGSDDEYIHRLKVSYEHCRAKEAELYVRLIPFIPEKHRPMFSTVANSYMTHSILNLTAYSDFELMDEYQEWLEKAQLYCLKYPLLNQKIIDEMNRDSIKDEYVRWCQFHVRLLNIFNEIPHNNAKYACDDIQLDLDERHQWLLDDIMRTYDHCRRTFYRVAKDIDKFVEKPRDDDVECVVDCFVRLYTLLDKSSKIITYLFPRDQNTKQQYFYDVAETLSNTSNPFLRSIYRVCMDIFPDKFAKTEGTFDPRNNMFGMVLKRGFIRNSIMHDTLKVFKEGETKTNYYGASSVTPLELFRCTDVMFQDVREILLSIQLAVEYRKNN